MKNEVISSYLKMMTQHFVVLSPCFGIKCVTLSGTLAQIAASFIIDHRYVNLKAEETKSNCALSDQEAERVNIEELMERFMQVNECQGIIDNGTTSMVRFNLYKACLVQLQRSFVKLRRVGNLFKDFFDESENQSIDSAIRTAFSKFKQYCAIVMELRK